MFFSYRLTTVICATAVVMAGCSDALWDWEPPAPGSAMAEERSPDSLFMARVIAAQAQGAYAFEVHDTRKDNVLAERTIAAPVGYHAHIVSLTWSDDSRIVTVTLDHDFGDDNRVFELVAEHAEAQPASDSDSRP